MTWLDGSKAGVLCPATEMWFDNSTKIRYFLPCILQDEVGYPSLWVLASLYLVNCALSVSFFVVMMCGIAKKARQHKKRNLSKVMVFLVLSTFFSSFLRLFLLAVPFQFSDFTLEFVGVLVPLYLMFCTFFLLSVYFLKTYLDATNGKVTSKCCRTVSPRTFVAVSVTINLLFLVCAVLYSVFVACDIITNVTVKNYDITTGGMNVLFSLPLFVFVASTAAIFTRRFGVMQRKQHASSQPIVFSILRSVAVVLIIVASITLVRSIYDLLDAADINPLQNYLDVLIEAEEDDAYYWAYLIFYGFF
mmetsp:Transcript_13475/g.35401  ORF Transcript_13475/g.35401 Transcript_13475/m.35401 type:complete len:304 (+) Transcript_13475:214-1125(+)